MESKGEKMYLYSAQTGGFYDPRVYGDAMPSDVCEVSVEEYTALLAAPEQGRVVMPDENGRPVISEAPVPTEKQLSAAERSWRDETLLKLCKVRDRHRDEQELFRQTTLAPEFFVELLIFIQQLRDWPQSNGFPDMNQRPLAPAWLAEHI
ncbi:phage tail assembly chaperone [Pseudomonas oryzicola]|uniref:Phage tail assembly chaperone n=1 Tax=Pseudomonas oryzicola TaxID=485876 RepID=A0ABS6QF30_9PSED|nr:phage tail assembly chaperone [Pseudomonas oryzicola]MBV4492564.1 phage tail assembly chaperone [Pseudomonas oryzicola]